MPAPEDPNFGERYNDILNAINNQAIRSGLPVSYVATSAAFAVARFSVWSMTGAAPDAKTLEANRQVILDNFTRVYREMLDEHYDDFVKNFEGYSRPQAVEIKD